MMGITACKYVSMFEDVVLAKIPLMLHSECCVYVGHNYVTSERIFRYLHTSLVEWFGDMDAHQLQ